MIHQQVSLLPLLIPYREMQFHSAVEPDNLLKAIINVAINDSMSKNPTATEILIHQTLAF